MRPIYDDKYKKPTWKVCSRCEVKYLPSATSHPTKCGICAPMQRACHSRAVEIRRKGLEPIPPEKVKEIMARLAAMPQNLDPKLRMGTNYCKCAACGEYFTCDKNFQLHRLGRGKERICRNPSTIHDKNGIARLRRTGEGLWASTMIGREYPNPS